MTAPVLPRGGGGRLVVTGGAGSTVAHLDELAAAARRWSSLGEDAGEATRWLAGVAWQSEVLAAAVAAPRAVLALEAAVAEAVLGPRGAARVAAELHALGLAVGAAAASYAEADAAADAAVQGARDAAARAAGATLRAAVLAALPAAVAAVAPVAAAAAGAAAVVGAAVVGRRLAERLGAEASVLLGELERGSLAPADLPRRVAAGAERALQGAVADAGGDLRAAGHEVADALAPVATAAGAVAVDAAFVAAPLVEPAVGAVPVAVGTATGLPAVAGVWPPRDVPALLGAVLLLSSATPALREGAVRVVPAQRRPPVPSRPPAGVRDLVGRSVDLSPRRSGVHDGQVRVERVVAADGSRAWVVAVPGTQSASVVPSRTPLDMTSNVHLLAGERAAASAVVMAALEQEGVRPGEPVMLVGHSQGGLAAAALAADPAVRQRYRVTHVLTTGAPVATAAVPHDVAVLSLEHEDDLVPTLDGERNPDGEGWTTVRRPSGAVARDPSSAHSAEAYLATAAAVDGSDDPSVRAWRAGAGAFLDAPGSTTSVADYRGERVPGPRGASS